MMKTKAENDEKTCLNWKCKRIIEGTSKSFLCPVCTNKYGTGAAVGVVGTLAVLGKMYGGKIIKGAINAVRHIK